MSMKYAVIILYFSIFGCVNNYDLKSTKNSHQKNITDWSYAGIYLSADDDSTHHGKIVINPYSNKFGEIYLSVCMIEVMDSALKPNYRIIDDVFVNENRMLIRGGEIIGKFESDKSGNNNKILVINGVVYLESNS